MAAINIKEDFSPTTGFRTPKDGPYSGEEFYLNLLRIKYQEAVEKDEKLTIMLDGGQGYTSSFLNEAFRLLGLQYGSDQVWSRLVIVSNEWPLYIEKIRTAVYEDPKSE